MVFVVLPPALPDADCPAWHGVMDQPADFMSLRGHGVGTQKGLDVVAL
jgi:hypothetical protein